MINLTVREEISKGRTLLKLVQVVEFCDNGNEHVVNKRAVNLFTT